MSWVVNCFQTLIFIDDSQCLCIDPFNAVVVNCFQTLIFIDDSQCYPLEGTLTACCELLSNTYLHWWFTVFGCCCLGYVGCELLSNTYLHWWFTVKTLLMLTCLPLWIAFKHLSSLMIHSKTAPHTRNLVVVNCFQTLIFIDDSQSWKDSSFVLFSCELLSNTYLHWWLHSQCKPCRR